MSKVAMLLGLSIWGTTAGAQDLTPPKAVAQVIQESMKTPASKDLKPADKPRNGVPQASKKPSVPLFLLDDKNFGLGCAQPS